ncbi:flagellar motor protein MotB [Brenneria populi subsp. brevivirga]|uniref:Flagellar motor protein MotB n=1 Tax=Brenneria populi TaxID=1505588 RepID=A0ABU6JWZ8_9GAMM|nr:flagellar motor protein MotB [Brenneria populi subsp. brevivirga]MEC5344826.1 flagellar motor protein MotB [Brenneria populi Li et al. 2015]
MKHQHPIIRKKRKSGHAGHHGGSWKIAYADFMTAMMALFLVMWLIAISTPMQLAQIAEYFRTPLKIALTGGSKSSESESPIPGGGDDPTQQQGEVKKSIKMDSPENRLDEIRLNRLRERLDQLIESDPRLRALRPHLLIEMVDEGLRIQIIDSQNRPMFKTGSSQVEPYMRDILRAIAPILNDIPNKLSISGHTDDVPYAMGERGYSNWELSADRANASRRELLSGGLSEGKVLRVVGMASTMSLKQAADSKDEINRRISLLVLTKEAQKNIEHENAEKSAQDVGSPEDLRNMGLENPKPAGSSADNSSDVNKTDETTPQPVNGVPAPERQQPTTELPAAPDSQATPSQ